MAKSVGVSTLPVKGFNKPYTRDEQALFCSMQIGENVDMILYEIDQLYKNNDALPAEDVALKFRRVVRLIRSVGKLSYTTTLNLCKHDLKKTDCNPKTGEDYFECTKCPLEIAVPCPDNKLWLTVL